MVYPTVAVFPLPLRTVNVNLPLPGVIVALVRTIGELLGEGFGFDPNVT